MLPTKIVLIGAGSASFGLNTLVALMRSERLRGSKIALVDYNQPALAAMGRLAERINREWDSAMGITTHTQLEQGDHGDYPLEGAEYVILSIEAQPREQLWRSDFEIPLKYGVRQPYAENSGPGGFAHAARNLGPVMEIVKAMEATCPEAWLINFTNPMMRICDAIARHSRIKVVGLCHQIHVGYAMVGKTLARDYNIQVPAGFDSTQASPRVIPLKNLVARQAVEHFDIQAAGLNHFSWMLELHDHQTSEDLMPLFARRWKELEPTFEPLTRLIYRVFGLFPIAGDEHLCEYLPWMSDPITRPWDEFDLTLYDWETWQRQREEGYAMISLMAEGQGNLAEIKGVPSEGAVELIENLNSEKPRRHLAVNVPNQGYIPNMPQGAVVEVPALVSQNGVNGETVSSLPDAIAELCRREITCTRLCVDAAIHGDRQTALQCLLLDPVVSDLGAADKILGDYLTEYRSYLPQFWG